MPLDLTKCPVCGKDIIKGTQHPECVGIDPLSLPHIVDHETIIIPAGGSLDDVMKALLGNSSHMLICGEQFDYQQTDGSFKLSINITEFKVAIGQGKVKHERILTPVLEDVVQTLIRNQSVEESKLFRLKPEALNTPIIFIKPLPDAESVVLCDGAHRYVLAYLLHQPEIRAHVVEFADWQPYGQLTMGE